MSSASDLVEGRAWTAHTASVSRECFQCSSLSVFGPCFSSEFVRVRVFSDCCFSCLSLGTCDAHIFISSHDRSSTLCSAYTHVHRSTTCCLVGRIVLFLPSPPLPQPLTGVTFTCFPASPLTRFDAQVFQVLLPRCSGASPAVLVHSTPLATTGRRARLRVCWVGKDLHSRGSGAGVQGSGRQGQ